MRIPSGKTDQSIYFFAADSTDLVTAETGLSSFTVYRSRNGGAATVYTTPTVSELSSANMPGLYRLIDEDTTIASGSDSEEYAVTITATGMAPVHRVIELYRRTATSGETLTVTTSRASVGFIANDTVTAASLNTDAVTEIVNAVWAAVTRTLTAGTNIVLAKGTGVTGFNDLSAAQVNAEADTALSDVGLTSTVTGRIDAAVSSRLASASYTAPDNASIAAILVDTGTDIPAQIAALSIPTAVQNADALLDRSAGIETGLTPVRRGGSLQRLARVRLPVWPRQRRSTVTHRLTARTASRPRSMLTVIARR